MEQQFSVTLEGGSPWGFGLQGGVDFRSPLRVARVSAGGKAAGAGLVAGDYILEINERPSKALKHMQAQQLIKQSRQVVTLTCSKQCPGVTTVLSVPQSPSHLPNRHTAVASPTSIKQPRRHSITKPKPPPMVCSNGVARSRSASTASSSPRTPHSNVEAYDVKFQGMYSFNSPGSHNQQQSKQAAAGESEAKTTPLPQDEVAVQLVAGSTPVVIELPPGYEINTSPPPESAIEEAINGGEEVIPPPEGEFGIRADEVSVSLPQAALQAASVEAMVQDIIHDACRIEGLSLIREPPSEMEQPVQDVPSEVEQPVQDVPSEVEQPVQDVPSEVEQPVQDVPSEVEQPVQDVPSEVEQPVQDVPSEMEQPVQDVPSELEQPVQDVPSEVEQRVQDVPSEVEQPVQDVPSEVEQPVQDVPSEVEQPVQDVPSEVEQPVQDVPSEAEQRVQDDQGPAVQDERPEVDQETTTQGPVDEGAPVADERPQGDWQYPVESSPPKGGPELFQKNAFASVLNAAAATHIVEEPEEELPAEPDPPAVVQDAPIPPPAEFEAKPEEESQHQREDSLHSSSSSSVEAAMATKEPGWYQQMFQNFATTVEECFPGASQPQDKAAVGQYDSRGLRVRSGSASNHHPPHETHNTEGVHIPEEDPVYVYDQRGLRVRAGSVGHEQKPKTAVEELKKDTRPKSAIILSVAPDMREDVLAATKRPTSYKATVYSTDGSRGYWKQKDQEHQDTERKRRLSWEKIAHRRSSSSSSDLATHREETDAHYSTKMMHPLLRDADESEPPKPANGEQQQQQPELFERIDPDKLQGALSNAGRLGALEHEGIPSSILPLKADKPEEQREKKLKPPPGRKAKALYDFEANTPKELGLKKGDIVDLTHTVDDNWLEGTVEGRKGMFPVTFVKVLTSEEVKKLFQEQPTAKALFDFSGQSDREISFKRGDVLVITNKVDANWYEGCLGDDKGIFPTSYVQMVEEGDQ